MKNYFSPEIAPNGRKRFKSELLKGRMLGGPGCTATDVKQLFELRFLCDPAGPSLRVTAPTGESFMITVMPLGTRIL